MGARAGIDLGGTKIQAAVVDDEHRVLGQARRPTPTEGGPQAVADALLEALRAALAEAGLETGDLSGVGVGSPGQVDAASGAVTSAKNLPGWAGTFPLGQTLADALGCRVAVGNDVQVATDAEFALGVGRDTQDLLGIFWGTGVGGGLVLRGERWLGRGSAAEVGHVVVVQDGRRCGCGRRGCMEAYAGRMSMEAHARKRHEKGDPTKLFELMQERGRTRLTSGVWSKAIEHGDELATELLDEAVVALGVGIASIQNVLDVSHIVLGGGMGVRFGPPMAERIATAMEPHLFHDEQPPVLAVAELGDLGGAIGAALLVSEAAPT